MARHRGTFKPEREEPYELSRGKIETLLNCPACFWLDRARGVKFPSIPGFLLNTNTDTLLKRDFDQYRGKEPHPIMVENNLNALPYKHHLNTVKAILDLNLIEGYNISLLLIGNNDYSSIGKKLNNLICKHNIVQWITEVKLDEIYKYYHDSDCFIFSSSCENMPISLIEAMASGLPIVCSNYKPMQEFLENAGLYFDPLSIDDTKNVLRKILDDKKLLKKLSKDSYNLSKKYTWEQCAQNTFKYLYEISKN